MLPLHTIALAVSQAIGSRVVVDGVEIKPDTAEQVLNGIEYAEGWVSVFEGLDVTKPQSIAAFAVDISRAFIEENTKRQVANVYKDMTNRGFMVTTSGLEWVIKTAIENMPETEDDKVDVIREYGDELLMSMDINGEPLYYVAPKQDPSEMQVTFIPVSAYSDDEKAGERFRVAIRDAIWSRDDMLLMDHSADGPHTSKVKFDKKPYRGEKLDYIDVWKKEVEQGGSRTVLIQGVPGTGKTTFACHVKREMSERTLMVSHSMLRRMDQPTWQTALHWLEPDMVFVDDLDRVSEKLSEHLYLFEDSHYSVPITLVTSNNFLALPSAARRCGRIDQILAMNAPTEEVIRSEIVQYAVEEGLLDSLEDADEIPEDAMDFLVSVHREYAGAGTREMVFRMSVHGVDYRPTFDDITFQKVTKNMDSSIFEQREDYEGGSSYASTRSLRGGQVSSDSERRLESMRERRKRRAKDLLSKSKP